MNKKEIFLMEIELFKEELKKEPLDKIIEEFYLKLYFVRCIEMYLKETSYTKIEKYFEKFESIFDVYCKYMSCSEYSVNTFEDIEEMLEF